jgi:ATP-dependent helicase/nuclease subunit A
MSQIELKPSTNLNEEQTKVAESIDGIYVVDAGAGTGKTTAITKRYNNILEKVKDPNKILLLTFTDNAAENMRNKIIKECAGGYNINDLKKAPISTFHSFCDKLIKQYGINSPNYIGISDALQNYGVMDNNIFERQFFGRFFNNFKTRQNQYNYIYKVTRYGEILNLIKQLCSKGIFPKKDGWFSNGEEILYGDFDLFKREKFDRLNKIQQGVKGDKQSKLLNDFKGKFEDSLYIDPPSDELLFRDKQINPEMAKIAFDDDRTLLMDFVHDVYFQYIIHCVKMNRINFDFMIMFAFIMLYNEHNLRDKIAFDYVMVDEFQDTDEIQFMMVLMLMKTNNLCAVGDWKQGIYSFRNATIENILEFDEKLKSHKHILNQDYERINFDISAEHPKFIMNYRSSQEILDFSEKSFSVQATKDEEIDENIKSKVTHLESAVDYIDKTNIEFLLADEKDQEYEFILTKIQDIVDNDNYLINEKKVRFKDIAILCRTRKFGLELQNRAMKYGIPVNYDGGIELFRTEPALLVLAWLRLKLNADDSRGWIPILEKEDLKYSEILTIIKEKKYPKTLIEFHNDLAKEEIDIVSLVDKILKFYNLTCNYSNAIIVKIEDLFKKSLIPISELVNFIEENIEQKETYDIDLNLSDDAVTIQTIHKAKGLEYSVVFIANVNESVFPSKQTERNSIFFHDLVGLRIKNEFGEKNSYKYIFDKWQTDLLATKLFSDYDEERRLLYVAITRAKQYLIFTASEKPSLFFDQMSEGFDVIKDYNLAVSPIKLEKSDIHDELSIGDYEKRGIVLGAHDLMQYKPSGNNKGRQFGIELHSFAQKVALGVNANWDQPEADRVRVFIASLNAKELKPEIECSLPIGDNLIRGEIDLLALYDDRAEIIDYKSDLNYINVKEYQKQLSVYYHVVRQIYPNKPVICKIYYVCLDEIKEIEPLSFGDIEALMKMETHPRTPLERGVLDN